MRGSFIVIFAVLLGAGYALWYIFVFAQSTTTQLNYGTEVVLVGLKTCAPPSAQREEVKCLESIKDDVGHYFLNKTATEKKLIIGENVRVEGQLTKPDEDILRKYQIDGIIVDTTKEQ
jgi:hypothetical protein